MTDVRSKLRYDEEDGRFYWLTGNRKGKEAGCARADGRWVIRINRKLYLRSRLAWLYINGCFPENEVDHINGCAWDDRIENLRAATSAQNKANIGVRKRSSTGVKGVSYYKKPNRWRAWIGTKGGSRYLGSFATKEEAVEFRNLAAFLIFGEYDSEHRLS